MRRLTPVRHGQGRFVDGSPFQAAAGSTRNLTAEAGDALEAAGFQRLGGARGHRYFQNPGLTCPYRQHRTAKSVQWTWYGATSALRCHVVISVRYREACNEVWAVCKAGVWLSCALACVDSRIGSMAGLCGRKTCVLG